MESKEYMELKREIGELSDCVKRQGETIKKIHNAIVGDKDFGQDGLAKMVKKHEQWIEGQKYMWAKIYGGIIAGSGIISFVLKYILG
jgi:hypothetical protein